MTEVMMDVALVFYTKYELSFRTLRLMPEGHASNQWRVALFKPQLYFELKGIWYLSIQSKRTPAPFYAYLRPPWAYPDYEANSGWGETNNSANWELDGYW